jgi:hypothetical protein
MLVSLHLSALASACDWQTIGLVTVFAMVARFLAWRPPAYHRQGKGAATSDSQFSIDRDNANVLVSSYRLNQKRIATKRAKAHQIDRFPSGHSHRFVLPVIACSRLSECLLAGHHAFAGVEDSYST